MRPSFRTPRESRRESFGSKRSRPPYLFRGQRPVINSAPATIGYREEITITTPQAGTIRSVALVRVASVTHGFSSDQRYVGLAFRQTSQNSLVATCPPDAVVAVPGYYMLFIVNRAGVPSLAKFVHLPAPATSPDTRTCEQIQEEIAEHKDLIVELTEETDGLDSSGPAEAKRRRVLLGMIVAQQKLIEEVMEAGRAKNCFA